MKWYQFSASERRGVIVFITIIALLQIGYFSLDYLVKIPVTYDWKDAELSALQKRIDSLKIAKQTPIYTIFPFNPNYITEYKAYQLGLSATEFNKIQSFRAQNKWINSTKDFQRVTGVNDSLLAVISPYFKFPDWVQNQKKKDVYKPEKQKYTKTKPKETIVVKDLNTATKEELMAVYGIGDKLSDRILDYRKKLQAFTENDQIYEVWKLDKEVAERVLERFQVLSKPTIKKINVNTATFKEVLHSSPYMDYETTVKIFNYKNAAGKVVELEYLKRLDGFPVERYDKIVRYLKVD
jgi:DNA uptake protein ComE-like DNA-binding protein